MQLAASPFHTGIHPERQSIPGTLHFLLLLFFLELSLWGTQSFHTSTCYRTPLSYALRFDVLYLLENFVWVFGRMFLIPAARLPWKINLSQSGWGGPP